MPEHDLRHTLHDYRRSFAEAADAYDGTTRRASDLEALMSGYADLVTDERNEAGLDLLRSDDPTGTATLVRDLRDQSARCASVAEKHRALALLEGRDDAAGYFDNVESCIAEELGALAPTAGSSVLLVGSGAFPMTLLEVARRTGAATFGVDVDEEAVDLGRRVVRRLGDGLDVALERRQVEELDFTRRATHVVFSSTVAAKYDLLDRLHPVTRDDVVVAMRFGDGLKSLFNYPRHPVDPRRWRLVDTVRRPGQVFDVAVYAKAHDVREVG